MFMRTLPGITSQAASGGGGYNPDMTYFDGTEYFSHTADETGSGNKITLTARFRGDYLDLGTGGTAYIFGAWIGSTLHCAWQVYAPDFADTNVRGRMRIACNDVSVNKCIIHTVEDVAFLDDGYHTMLFSFDLLAGTAVWYIDGNDVIDATAPNHVLTSGDGWAVTNGDTGVAAANDVGASPFPGSLGSMGFTRTNYITDPDLFMSGRHPVEEDTVGWTQWGGTQPAHWSTNGKFDTNDLGHASTLAVTGTPTQFTPANP
jgi:hypothetical protein